jgi:GNAT superfamily N-acetyltransferase
MCLLDTKLIWRSSPVLGSLATHPDETGRGCASMLLKWGIDQAERNGARIFLSSMPAAHNLYLRYGWRDVDEIQLKLGEHENGETVVINAMVRDPQRPQS